MNLAPALVPPHFALPHPLTILAPGTPAPDFRLNSTPDQTVALSDFLGRPVVLVFFPADWCPVCSDQLDLYEKTLPEFHRLNANLLGISVDGAWCHAAFRRDRKFRFPLLADFQPKGVVARRYGAYRPDEGVSERALFVINSNGIIHWSHLAPLGVNPGAAGIFAALEELQSREESK